MTTTLYFIRHAEPNYNNHDDVSRELTEKGIDSSQKLVSQFSSVVIDKFYSSPYKRSIDTLKPLADSKNKQITIIDELRERKLSEGWIDNFNEVAQKQWEDFNYKLPKGESLKEVQERNIGALNTILATSRGKTVVIGTHGTALSTIINYYQQDFNFDKFNKYKHEFPWIVKFEFNENDKNNIEIIIE
ncbi:histidine phosphatase family protein [Streptococcus iniae]|uniref:histidine phosphatase family protein n=1 Tax=Streptococcus iniae TaxID=1346 RepID=UPI0002F0C891|nr:histidine phosphatase family protein [Streptococcus iniae]OHX27921.1 histidine phosphatase family protein [Streptococcus iniae]RLV28613.1 histidine phosphatase family protein [Streptococcus iniae]